MVGGSFSLTEKLAVTGAFLALVALVVGTEDDPGLVVAGQEAARELHIAAPAPAPAQAITSGPAVPQRQAEPELTPPPSLPESDIPEALSAPLDEGADENESDDQFSPELGRVPRDFSKGPPVT